MGALLLSLSALHPTYQINKINKNFKLLVYTEQIFIVKLNNQAPKPFFSSSSEAKYG